MPSDSTLFFIQCNSEIGKLTLDATFEEREVLSAKVVHNVNAAATEWGVQALRCEIRET